jgi:SIR2-like domain
MKQYLLIGAGFSRNWGGWLANEAFEYLLGDPVIVENPGLRDLLWEYQPKGGFEAALDELQRGSSSGAKQHEQALLSAVTRMFDAMNGAFKALPHLEFGDWVGVQKPVRDFLVRFEAIFSLNQDLLLEYAYRGTSDGPVDRNDPRTQRSWQIPGMKMAGLTDFSTYPAEAGLWIPSGDPTIEPDQQMILKLHGSSNWRTAEGSAVMILGGGKVQAIARSPVLKWYAELFRERIARPDAKLMIIGYGFRGGHINQILEGAIDRGLKVFINDLNGVTAGDAANRVPADGLGYTPVTLQQKLMKALIGASRRPLSSTLSRDAVERHKFERFFQ